MHFNVAGTYDNPKINLAGTSSEGGTVTTVKEQVQQEALEQAETMKAEAEAKLKDEADKIVEEGEKKVQQQVDTVKKEITKNLEEEAGKVIGEELDSTTNELKESLKSLFKKKKKNE